MEDDMQVQLLVERDQNECTVKLAGTAYKFKRNEHGHLVSEITDQEHIKWVSDPHNTSFKMYAPPKAKVIEEVVADIVDQFAYDPSVEVEHVHKQTPPPYPQKGSKRPTKRKN